MRFLVHPTGEALARARAPVRMFLGFAAVLLAVLAVQRVMAGGLDPLEVELLMRPDGPGPQALGSPLLWEEIHIGAFLDGFLFLMLGSILIVSPVAPQRRAALLWGTFVVVLADVVMPAVVALGGGGALRVVSGVAAFVALGGCLVVAAARFGRERR